MKFYDLQLAKELIWTKQNANLLSLDKTLISPKLIFDKKSILPSDAGAKTILARAITESLKGQSDIFLWIYDIDVWPSCQNIELLNGYRYYLGEERSIEKVPCHLFDHSELEKLNSLLCLVLYFFWSAILFDSNKCIQIIISHDEWIRIASSDKAKVENLTELLNDQTSESLESNG